MDPASVIYVSIMKRRHNIFLWNAATQKMPSLLFLTIMVLGPILILLWVYLFSNTYTAGFVGIHQTHPFFICPYFYFGPSGSNETNVFLKGLLHRFMGF